MSAAYRKLDERLVIYVIPIANIGAGMTWSGLPLLLSSQTNDYGNVFILFMSSMAAGALFTLIGGSLADAFRRKSFVIASLCIDVCLTLSLAYFGTKDSVLLFYLVSFSSALVGAMSGSALNVWIKDILSSTTDSLSRSLAARGMWNILSKAAGFALGPLVYSALEFDALFIDAAFSAIPAIALAFVLDLKMRGAGGLDWSGGYGEIFTRSFWNPERRLILSLFTLTATYTVPTVMISYAILLKRYGAGEMEASTFWLLASAGSVASHFGMTRRLAGAFDSSNRLLFSQLLMAAAFAGLWFAPTPLWFAAAFVLFTLSNPVMTNALQTEVYEKCEDVFRGRFNALCQLADDVAGLLVLFVCQQMIDTGLVDRFYLYALPLMAITLLLVVKSRDRLTSRIGTVPSAGFGHQ
ncbi:MAG: MFS transporter [Rhizobiaceae bacterium]